MWNHPQSIVRIYLSIYLSIHLSVYIYIYIYISIYISKYRKNFLKQPWLSLNRCSPCRHVVIMCINHHSNIYKTRNYIFSCEYWSPIIASCLGRYSQTADNKCVCSVLAVDHVYERYCVILQIIAIQTNRDVKYRIPCNNKTLIYVCTHTHTHTHIRTHARMGVVELS